jgi:hypothetical protein
MLTEPRLVQTRTTRFRLTHAGTGRIDLTTVAHDTPTRLHTRGIYALRGDKLTYCIARPAGARPLEFATAKDDGRTLVVLRRGPAGGL